MSELKEDQGSMMWLFKNEARCCPKRQFPTCISEAEMESKFNSVFAIKLEANMISVIGDALNQTLTMTLYYPRHEYEPLKGIVAQNYLGEAKLLMNNIRIFKKFLIHEEEILLRDKLEKMGFFTIFCQRCYEQLDSCKYSFMYTYRRLYRKSGDNGTKPRPNFYDIYYFRRN